MLLTLRPAQTSPGGPRYQAPDGTRPVPDDSFSLELEWVLRAFYGFGRAEFVGVIRHLMGLPNVHLEDWEGVHGALQWHLQGLDFADALHLASSAHCDALLTFDDKRFARKANRMGFKPRVQTPG
jgi:predicted nucleic-acid-binding protein